MSKALLRQIGIVALKHALNAILTNSGLAIMLHGAFNTSTTAGLWNIGKATLAVVVSREALVWVPKLIAWTQKNAEAPDLP